MKQLRLKVISCESLSRELYLAAAFSSHIVDLKFFARKAHEVPEQMRSSIQFEIDRTGSGKSRVPESGCDILCPACLDTQYDYIVIAIGLCGNATAGVRAGDTPLIIPKTHDCNSFLMGSAGRFKEFMAEDPGTIFYHFGQVERSTDIGMIDSVPKNTGLGGTYEEYEKKYGKENAKYLIDFEYKWTRSHKRAAYLYPESAGEVIDWKMNEVKDYASQFNWRVERLAESGEFFRLMLSGSWDEEYFLTVRPGEEIVPSYDDGVIRCK